MAPEITFEIIILAISAGLAISLHSVYFLIIPIVSLIFLFISFFFAFFWAPYVPSNKQRIKTMTSLIKIKKNVRFYDLGAGNGKVVDAAARLGANAIGYEISLPLVIKFNILKILGHRKGKLLFGDFTKKNLDDAEIIYCYLLPHSMQTFYKTIYPKLKPGTKIISNSFKIEGLKPRECLNSVYLYVKK